MSLLRQYRRYAVPDLAKYIRFIVADRHVGWLKPDFAHELAAYAAVFRLLNNDLHMVPLGVDERSLAMANVLNDLRVQNRIPGWRDELYPVNQRFGEKPLMVMERAAAPLFGVLTYGVNLNGFVGRGWEMKIWVARRSPNKTVDPHMLDLIVGGGQPLGLTPRENLLKECQEEAGIPAKIAGQAQSVSVVTLLIEAAEGLRVGQQFNFDLELPADFFPENYDGEVEHFELIPVSELIHRLRSADDFMYDIAVVLIDFLVRHGFVGPDEKDYMSLIAGLRQPIPFTQQVCG